MFAKARGRNERSSSGTVNGHNAAPLVSPLQMNFDFGLASKPYTPDSQYRPSDDSLRPKTSDGISISENRKSIVGLQPPVLPPIPRVASRYESSGHTESRESKATASSGRARDEGDDASSYSANSRKSQLLSSRLSFEHPIDMMPTLSRPASFGPKMSETTPTASGSSSPKMESSLFPKAAPFLSLPPINSGPPMSREFIDSRDKPYSNPPPRPAPMQASLSTPTMPTFQPPSTYQSSFAVQRPMSPSSMTPSSATSLRAPKISGARLSPNSSVDDLRLSLQHIQPPSSATRDYLGTAASNYSGTTARPSTHASTSPIVSATLPMRSPLEPSTIGTPYQATSASFPLPQHVATRPKTAGGMASVAGVNVPTHHTSSLRPEPAKAEKRKTRLLNPMALLVRRRSGQDVDVGVAERSAERSAAAQAYARQKSVAAVGLSNVPEDFDPRIRGKVVHDFSAPRPPRRNHSYNEADGTSPEGWLPSPIGAPSVPALREDLVADQQATAHNKQPSDSSSARRSAHSPIFREMLTEDPDAAKRVSSLNAERLENKGFLQRVSHHSSVSTFSQESAVLPPFARRSQILDPTQAALYGDDESKRSSDPSSGKQRDSNPSSISSMSPTMGRSSNPVSERPISLATNLSPVSPSSSDRAARPVSDLPPKAAPASPEDHGRAQSSFIARPYSVVLSPPAIDTIAEQPESPKPGPSPSRDSSDAPEALFIASRDSALAPEAYNMFLSMPETSPSLITPDLTPEIAVADSFMAPKPSQGPAKIVEKRASAVGHAKRSSLTPKHHVSNASRFSFQFGESAAQEHALEEKHRRTISSGDSLGHPQRQASPDDDEEDFDEDAMDDMDELEVQGQTEHHFAAMGDARGSKAMRIQHPVPEAHVADSSEGSVYDDDEEGEPPAPRDERELTYAEHPAFRAHSAMAGAHSRNASQLTSTLGDGNIDQHEAVQQSSGMKKSHQRIRSDASILTLDTNVQGLGNANFVQDHFSAHESLPGGVGGVRPRSGFYMQPQAAGYSPTASPSQERPPLPHRDSGNSERNRAASGMSFGSADGRAKHPSGLSSSTAPSNRPESQRVTSPSTLGGSSSSEPRTTSTGLGLGGFGDFNFSDGPDLTMNESRPTSLDPNEKANLNRRTRDSETIPPNAGWAGLQRFASRETPPPQDNRKSYFSSTGNDSAAYRGHIGQNIRARNAAVDQNRQYAASDSGADSGDDDMYYDDGGFEQDIKDTRHNRIDSIDENDFDNEAFLRKPKGVGGRTSHQVGMGALARLGGDGPYPSFAMGSNPTVARQRQSQLLLEDLPLAGPVDPKLIPQRNPSEDAKRLGLSSRVPPLPPQPGSKEAEARTRASLLAYHNTLADALNRAAAEGRFVRQPSVATARSVSVYSNAANEDKANVLRDDHSNYSQEDVSINGAPQHLSVDRGLTRSISQETSGSKMDHSRTYSPPKMSFDFGFDTQNTDNTDVNDDYENDDDMVAAANAEALASDDDGFYGQEFGFYANARPNSSDANAVNGGFFGADGDDGLARNKSLKEPNLTPITERSEFSTRNSFINLGYGAAFGLPNTGTFAPASPALARLPTSPLAEGGVTSFDQLRKLPGNVLSGSTGSLLSEGRGPGIAAWQSAAAHSPNISTRSLAASSGYFGAVGGVPMAFGYSNDSSGSSNPSSGHPAYAPNHFHDSPQSASSLQIPFSMNDVDATPKKGQPVGYDQQPSAPTARKTSAPPAANGHGHSRKGSDSVTYVREPDPAGKGQPRWVLERRRTSEQGQLELVGREVVQGGWI